MMKVILSTFGMCASFFKCVWGLNNNDASELQDGEV